MLKLVIKRGAAHTVSQLGFHHTYVVHAPVFRFSPSNVARGLEYGSGWIDDDDDGDLSFGPVSNTLSRQRGGGIHNNDLFTAVASLFGGALGVCVRDKS